MGMEDYIPAARGLEPADLVFKGARVFNVFSGEFEERDLAVKGKYIVGLGKYSGREEIGVKGRILVPGLIEPHFHIESSMITPAELTRVLLTHAPPPWWPTPMRLPTSWALPV